MSKYYTGVDVGYKGDYSAYCVSRTLHWYEKLWFKLRGKRAPHLKIVSLETYPELPQRSAPKPRKQDKSI